MEAGNQGGHKKEHDGVDDKGEEPEGQNVEGERHNEEDRADQRVDQPQERGGPQEGRKVSDRDSFNKPGHDPEGDRVEDPANDDPPDHDATIAFLQSTSNRKLPIGSCQFEVEGPAGSLDTTGRPLIAFIVERITLPENSSE